MNETIAREVELLQELWCNCEDGSDNDYYVPDGEGVIENTTGYAVYVIK